MAPYPRQFARPIPAMPYDRGLIAVSASATPSSASFPRDLTTRAAPNGPGRVEEADPRFPSYTPLMALLSLAYLVVALAFGACVIDAVGTGLSGAQLGALATWNRTLFGCAVALGIWGMLLLPWLETSRLSWRWRWLLLVCAGVVGMAVSIALQKGAELWMTRTPTGQQAGTRERAAVQLSLLAHASMEARIAVPALGLNADRLTSPAGKAFLALLLATEMTDPRREGLTDDAIRAAMQTVAAQRVGTAAQVYDNVFVPSVRSLKDAYNAYVAAQTALVEDINAILEQQSNAWNNYLEGLSKRGLTPQKLTRPDWPAIAAEVRNTGVAVPADWNPSDRATYVAALSTQQRKQADTQYADRLNRLFGTELPPGLEWEQFHANPIVQARWRAAINAPEDTILSPAMGFPAFEQAVYRPMIDQIIQPKLRTLLSPPASYAPGGPMAAIGDAAELRISLPAIALVFVLIGLIWHGCGLAAYTARMVLPRWPGRRRALALALGAVGLFVLGARNPVTRSDGFNQMQDAIADRAGPAWLAALGMVEAYGVAHPWGELLRRTVLGHQDFGLDPFNGAKADQQAVLNKLLP